jgi:uncharacterized integral membrane protein
MVKRILTAIILLAALAVSVLFTSLNPQRIALDLGFREIDGPLGLVFVLVLSLGWLLGVVSVLAWAGRLVGERRRLRAELRKLGGASLPVVDERG